MADSRVNKLGFVELMNTPNKIAFPSGEGGSRLSADG